MTRLIVMISIMTILLPFSQLQAETAKQEFARYLLMMKDDTLNYNFYNGVRHIMKQPARFLPYLEEALDNSDPQIVFGCAFILTTIEDYFGNQRLHEILVENLRDDTRSCYNIYLFNAYEAAVWLYAHYQSARPAILTGMASDDVQQLAFLSLIIADHDSSYDFRTHFPLPKPQQLALHLNHDAIRYNATYTTILFLLIGQQFLEEFAILEQRIAFDQQGKQLFAYIRKSIRQNNSSFDWGELELHKPNYLGWHGKRHVYYDLSGTLDRGYMSPFHEREQE